MKKGKKLILSVILAALIVMPVFASKYGISELKVGDKLNPGDEITESNNYYTLRNIKYCNLDGENCYESAYSYGSSTSSSQNVNIVWELSDYNAVSSVPIDEQDSNGQDFIGWEITKIYNLTSTSNTDKEMIVIPKYGVKHKIIKEPTTDNPTVEVTESDGVEKYTWYNNKKYHKMINEQFEDNVTQPVQKLDDNVMSYDENENKYSIKYKNININSTAKIDIEENAKIKIEFTDGSFIKNSTNSGDIDFVIFQNDYSNIISEYYPTEQNTTCTDKENYKDCTATFDLSDINPGLYDFSILHLTKSTDELTSTIYLENVDIYLEETIEVQKETEKTLNNGENGNEYYVEIKYNDGQVLKSKVFTYKKSVQEKIIDIVANPLTGDNIIYTIILGLISLTIIVILTKKLKQN